MRPPKNELGTRVEILDTPEGFDTGALVIASLPRACHIGFRDGDTLYGEVSNRIFDKPMIAIHPDGTAWMGRVLIVDCRRFSILTEGNWAVLHSDEWALVEIKLRQTKKGRKAQPPISIEKHLARYEKSKTA